MMVSARIDSLGDKLHVSGAVFIASASSCVGPFGDGEELDLGVLHK